MVEEKDPSRELKAAETRMKQLEAEAKELMTRMKSQAQVTQVEVAPQGQPKADAQARDLVDKSLEIARLEAQIRRDYQAYQERPKRKFVGARAAEYRFAQYVDNWRLKIERIGNLNYPEEARTRKLYGSLQLTVAIKADGEVESVEINRSSGHKVLDQAAIRIVRLASPFDRFPQNIRVDTDILHITRTWTFTRADQVFAE
jgi:protein TonB